MFLIFVALTLIAVGGLLWLGNAYLRTDGKTKSVLNAVICLCSTVGTLAGCIGYTSQGRGGSGYGAHSGVAATVVMQDDYVYYPGYDLYYSSNRRQYVYQDGGAWVSRPTPRGVSVDVLFASPSVRMDFHDSPERHHAEVVKQYPRNWTPRGSNQGQRQNQKDDKHDKDDKGDDHR